MKQKTNKPNTQEKSVAAVADVQAVSSHMSQDLKTSLLIVSVVANLFVFIAWVTIQVTSQYDAQLVSFLFAR